MAAKSVEIITAHNIRIDYELASASDRIIAFIIDFSIVIGWNILIFLFTSGVADDTRELIMEIMCTPVVLLYNLTCETFFGGQSIGKRSMSLKVVRMNGHNPTMGDCLMRWVLRLIDIGGTSGALAAILVSSTDRGQRLGDMAANTVVIRLNPPNRYTINDILTIKSKEEYVPVYSNAIQFTDEDMLLVKRSLERMKKYPNPINKKLISELSVKISDKLQMKEIPKDQVKFLRTVLQDYIVLTR